LTFFISTTFEMVLYETIKMAGHATAMAKTFPSRLPPLPSTRDLVRLYKLRAVKQLGQNFLMDSKLTSKLVRSGGRLDGSYVCEVGPGPGGLTRSILEQGAKSVTVIEKDPRFIPSLELLKDASRDRLNIHIGDVLSFNLENIFPQELKRSWNDRPPNIHLIGNLPFNVATPLIIKWLHSISLQSNAWTYGRVRMTLTFQKEVAERIVAPPGDAQRCRLSVMCQNWCAVKHNFTIPGKAFVPKPDVDVGVVSFTPRVEPLIPLDFKMVEKIIRNVFQFRQKYCKKSAGMLFPEGLREELVTKLLVVSDIKPTLAAYQLTNMEYSRLCHAYAAIIEENPGIAKYNSRDRKKLIIEGEDFDDDNEISYVQEEVDNR